MASSTEAHIPLLYPDQPHDLYRHPHIFPAPSRMDNFESVSMSGSEITTSDKSDSDFSSSTDIEPPDSGSDAGLRSVDGPPGVVVDTTVSDMAIHSVATSSSRPTSETSMSVTSLHPAQLRSPPLPLSVESDMQMQIAALQVRVKNLEEDLENAKAQCALALHKLRRASKRLNTKRKKSRAQNIGAWWLTSTEGLRECEVQDAARAEKKKKQVAVAARKAAKQADRITRQVVQRSGGFRFSGTLSTKTKEDLIDIATQLKIEIGGTKANLLKTIRIYFNTHANLKTDLRFVGLFGGRSYACTSGVGQTDVENIPTAPLADNQVHFEPATSTSL